MFIEFVGKCSVVEFSIIMGPIVKYVSAHFKYIQIYVHNIKTIFELEEQSIQKMI